MNIVASSRTPRETRASEARHRVRADVLDVQVRRVGSLGRREARADAHVGEQVIRTGFFASAHAASLRVILYAGALTLIAVVLVVGIGLIRAR